jgi:nicotinate phosphoribosyltransferase
MATKASRVVYAARGKSVVEFGLRRAHGIDAGMHVARSSYIAGCEGTSNVLAGMVYGIPVFGTMAHSFIMSYSKELDAFRAFVKSFPNRSTLLIDTYEEFAGLEKAVIVAKELEAKGFQLGGVRLDSGNLAETSKKVRKILDDNNLGYVKIFVSGNLDENHIAELFRKGAKIDSFGVGTKMGTSSDRPYIDVIYKLCETMTAPNVYLPSMKLSCDKSTLPGRKQVYRYRDSKGNYVRDVIALDFEKVSNAEPLLVKVMVEGKMVYTLPSLKQIKEFALENLSRLPEKHKVLTDAERYPVETSQKLQDLVKTVREKISKDEKISNTHI